MLGTAIIPNLQGKKLRHRDVKARQDGAAPNPSPGRLAPEPHGEPDAEVSRGAHQGSGWFLPVNQGRATESGIKIRPSVKGCPT